MITPRIPRLASGICTELGDHRFDAELTDYSPDTLVRLLAVPTIPRSAQEVRRFSQLTGANQVDVRILRDNIDNEIFELEELRKPTGPARLQSKSRQQSLPARRARLRLAEKAFGICASAWRRFQP